MMLAEEFREWRRRVKERRVRESVAQNQGQWEDWNNRRIEAEKNNLPFNEPTPSLEDFKNGSGV